MKTLNVTQGKRDLENVCNSTTSLPFNHCFYFSLQYNFLHEDLFPEPFKCVDSERALFGFRLN